MKTKTAKVAKIIAVIGAVCMLLTVFLPYSTATQKQKDNLNRYPDAVLYEELGMKAKDLLNLSLMEYTRVYSSDTSLGNDIGVLYIVLLAVIGGMTLLALLKTIKGKPVGSLVFTGISLAAFLLLRFDFVDRGVVPSESYTWGFGYYLFYIGIIAVAAGAVWQFAIKRRGEYPPKQDN